MKVMDNPWIGHLRTFLAVARTGSQAAAGRVVHRTQPAVWKQMRLLEEFVGSPLFERKGHGLRLTPVGRALGGEAVGLIDRADAVAQRLREISGGVVGHLRIGASTTPAHYLLPAVLGAYLRRFTKVTFSLALGNSDGIEAGVAEGEYDIGIVGRPARSSRLESAPFYRDRLVLVAAPGRRVSFRRLRKESWIVREIGSATRELTDRWLDERGIRPRLRLELPSPEMVKRAVASGLGVGVVSRAAIAWEVSSGRLRIVPGPGLPVQRTLYLIYRRGLFLCRALSELIDMFNFSEVHP